MKQRGETLRGSVEFTHHDPETVDTDIEELIETHDGPSWIVLSSEVPGQASSLQQFIKTDEVTSNLTTIEGLKETPLASKKRLNGSDDENAGPS